MRTRATNDAADQVASHSPILSAEFAWQGLRACLPAGGMGWSLLHRCKDHANNPIHRWLLSAKKLE